MRFILDNVGENIISGLTIIDLTNENEDNETENPPTVNLMHHLSDFEDEDSIDDE